jgi:transcriptional regulator with XRE-family HTH domain
MEDVMNPGQGLRKLRKEKGLTLKKVAESSGLSMNNISDIENNKRSPYLKTLLRIGKSSNLDMHRLAHYSFGLPEPEYLGEEAEPLRQIVAILRSMDEGSQRSALDYIRWLSSQEIRGGVEEKARTGPLR